MVEFCKKNLKVGMAREEGSFVNARRVSGGGVSNFRHSIPRVLIILSIDTHIIAKISFTSIPQSIEISLLYNLSLWQTYAMLVSRYETNR
jgi:hypothetical protein